MAELTERKIKLRNKRKVHRKEAVEEVVGVILKMIIIGLVELAAGAWLIICRYSTINGVGLVIAFVSGCVTTCVVFQPQKTPPKEPRIPN